MYARVLLMKMTNKDDQIELPCPLGEKCYFSQLEVSA